MGSSKTTSLTLGSLITQYRDRRGMTVTQLADVAGVNPPVVAGWEKDLTMPQVPALRAVIAALQMPAEAVIARVPAVALLPVLWCPRLGERLATRREELGLSDRYVAAQAGISTATLWRWEAARRRPRPAKLVALLEVLQLTVAELLPLGEWPPAETPQGERGVFGRWIATIRSERNLSQHGFAAELGISQGALNTWETGSGFPSRELWPTVARRFTAIGATISVTQLSMMQPPERMRSDKLAALPPIARLLATGRIRSLLARETTADLLQVPIHRWRNWEKGKTLPTLDMWPALRRVLDLGDDELHEALQAERFGDRRDAGTIVWARRTALGLTPRQLADKVGVHRNRVSEWETGRSRIFAEYRRKAEVALRLPAGTLGLLDTVYEPTEQIRFGQLMRDKREAAGLSQRRAGTLVGLPQSAVSGFEKGLWRPNDTVIETLYALYDGQRALATV